MKSCEFARGLCIVVLLGAGAARAEEEWPGRTLAVNLDAPPIRDIRESSASPVMGFAGSLVGEGEYSKHFFVDDRENTARIFREAGIRLVRQWDAVKQWQMGAGCGRSYRSKPGFNYEEYRCDMKEVFSFYRDYGIKAMLTLENYGVYMDAAKGVETNDLAIVTKTIADYVQWIVDNGFTNCVAGFELGNEPYFLARDMVKYSPEWYAGRWKPVVRELKRIWPGAPIGIALAEYYKNDPDVKAVRARLLSDSKMEEKKGYFDEGLVNRWAGRYVVAMGEVLPLIDHVIYHSYGGDIPYSATWCGIERYRAFSRTFPELQGKKFWITEWRDRSDEDNRSHQRFRETQFKAGYMLMMTAQPDVDGLNLHSLNCLSGALYLSGQAPASAPYWQSHDQAVYTVQWDSNNRTRPDWRSVGRPRLEVGIAGPLFRLYTDALIRHPLVVDYGTTRLGTKRQGKPHAPWSSGKFYGAFRAYRAAIREGRNPPELWKDCEYVVATNPKKDELVVLAVNYGADAETIALSSDKHRFCGPDYRVYDCPAEYLDCHELPGEGKFTRQYGYEAYPWAESTSCRLKIPANAIVTVTIPLKGK